MIKLVRVDHRLLHGQVAFAWTKNLSVDCILIANDEVAADKLRMAALRMAAPAGVKVVIKNIVDSVAAIQSGKTDKYHLMIILESIKDADRLTDKLRMIKHVNLGGVKKEEGKKQISMAVFVSEEETKLLRNMHDRGVELEIKLVPEDKSQDVNDNDTDLPGSCFWIFEQFLWKRKYRTPTGNGNINRIGSGRYAPWNHDRSNIGISVAGSFPNWSK